LSLGRCSYAHCTILCPISTVWPTARRHTVTWPFSTAFVFDQVSRAHNEVNGLLKKPWLVHQAKLRLPSPHFRQCLYGLRIALAVTEIEVGNHREFKLVGSRYALSSLAQSFSRDRLLPSSLLTGQLASPSPSSPASLSMYPSKRHGPSHAQPQMHIPVVSV
jgi:hypothetical protein